MFPSEIDEEFARAAFQSAAADQFTYVAERLLDVAADIAGGGTVDRAKLVSAFEQVNHAREQMMPVLEYARAFVDQWPDSDDEATSER